MASVREQITIAAPPDTVWDALRDWGALHVRLAPGFVTDVRLDGEDRIVTFATGTVLREVLVDRDDEARRLVWTIVDGPYTHHNGAAQVDARADGMTEFTWTADLLPHAAAPATAQAMRAGLQAIRRTLEAAG